MLVPASTSPVRIYAAATLLALVTLAAWSNSLDGPFVLDDIQNITRNETISDFGRAFSPPADSSVGGRPFLNFSFALNHAVGGTAVRGYHVTNLAIHVLAALTLFGLARRTLALIRPASATALALGASLLWALHPLQTAAITYVSQRAESLMGLCYFLVLYCTARSAAPGATRLWQLAAVAACLLGVCTKEVIVTAPLIALLYDRTFLTGSFREAWRRRAPLYLGLIASCCLLFWLMRGIESRGVAAAGTTPWQYALVQCRVLVSYLKLVVWPSPLVFDYGQFEAVPLRSALGALVLAPLVVGTAVALIRRPVLGFVGAFFFVVLAPTSSVVPVTFQPMGEHRLYVPLAALSVAAVVSVSALLQRRVLLPCVILAAASFTLVWHRNNDYRDPVRLWAGTLALRPDNFRAQNEYALSLAVAGRADEAIASMRRALARKPEASSLQRNLALLLMRERRTEEALPHFAQLVKLEPNFVPGRQEYARALALTGRLSDAIEQVRAGSALLPRAAGPHLELGELLTQAGRSDEALAEFESAVRLEPDNPQARNELGAALLARNRDHDALAQFKAGLRMAPENSTLLLHLTRTLLSLGRPADALARAETLIRLEPASAEVRFTLANTLAALGRLPEALAEYDHTLRLDPGFPQAREIRDLIRARATR